MLRVLAIGIGNAYRRDDAVGLVVARELKRLAGDACTVLEHSGEGAQLIDLWEGADAVIVIDAAHSGAPPGTIHRMDSSSAPLSAQAFRHSTHAFNLFEAIELARTLGRLPPRLTVYGIEGGDFRAGEGLSAEVRVAAQMLVERLKTEVRS